MRQVIGEPRSSVCTWSLSPGECDDEFKISLHNRIRFRSAGSAVLCCWCPAGASAFCTVRASDEHAGARSSCPNVEHSSRPARFAGRTNCAVLIHCWPRLLRRRRPARGPAASAVAREKSRAQGQGVARCRSETALGRAHRRWRRYPMWSHGWPMTSSGRQISATHSSHRKPTSCTPSNVCVRRHRRKAIWCRRHSKQWRRRWSRANL